MNFCQRTQIYAIRVREYYEAVAQLGAFRGIGPGLLTLMQEINRRCALCDEARDELNRYVAQARSWQVARGREELDTNHTLHQQLPEIEADLREGLRAAKESHDKAKQDVKKLREVGNDLGLNHPDGSAAILKAAHIESHAFRRYTEARGAFNNFVLHHKLPRDLSRK
jgi:hypothetical protein